MIIFINGEEVKVSLYDDENTLLSRYSLLVADSKPQYLRFITKDYQIRKHVKLKVKDIREDLRNLTIDDLYDESVMLNLLIQYPRLDKSDVILLWLIEHYTSEDVKDMNKEDFKIIQRLNPGKFPNQTKTSNRMKNYHKELKQDIKNLSDEEHDRKEVMESLRKVDKIKTDEFSLEEVTVSYIINVSTGTSLEDIFDLMEASKDIPFIFLSHKGRKWYKIYSQFVPLDEWLIEDYEDGLYFKIFNAPHSKLSSRIKQKNLYSEGRWITSNNVEITINIRSQVGEEGIKRRFESSLQNLEYSLVSSQQISIRGTFIIPDFVFNKAIMAYLISNDSIMKYFMFLQEVKKSAIDKRDFYFFYYPNQRGYTGESLKLTLTPHSEKRGIWTTVRVAKASNQRQVDVLRRVFSKLMGLYLEKQKRVEQFYELVIADGKKLLGAYTVKIKEKTKDQKTGKRLQKLQMQRPGLFAPGYSVRCSPIDRQPYLLGSSKVEKFIEKHGEHAVVNYPGTNDYYACVPREKSDKTKKYMWPGLKINTNPKNKDEFRLAPCCFENDQYEKTSSEVYKIMHPEEIKEPLQKIELSYIYGPKRALTDGRLGEVPYYLKFMFMDAGYKEEQRGNKVTVPILRLGVLKSPDSFFHCLEKVFNPRYSSMRKDEREQRIIKVRKEMSMMDYEVAKQQLYDYSDEEIKEELLDIGSYIDPNKWIQLAEEYYKCNIFLYQMDSQHPNGCISIPRSSQAYLSPKFIRKNPSVFIIKTEFSEDHPYQCELFVEFNPEGPAQQRFIYSFGKNHKRLIRTAKRFFVQSNEVSIVSIDGYIEYK